MHDFHRAMLDEMRRQRIGRGSGSGRARRELLSRASNTGGDPTALATMMGWEVKQGRRKTTISQRRDKGLEPIVYIVEKAPPKHVKEFLHAIAQEQYDMNFLFDRFLVDLATQEANGGERRFQRACFPGILAEIYVSHCIDAIIESDRAPYIRRASTIDRPLVAGGYEFKTEPYGGITVARTDYSGNEQRNEFDQLLFVNAEPESIALTPLIVEITLHHDIKKVRAKMCRKRDFAADVFGVEPYIAVLVPQDVYVKPSAYNDQIPRFIREGGIVVPLPFSKSQFEREARALYDTLPGRLIAERPDVEANDLLVS